MSITTLAEQDAIMLRLFGRSFGSVMNDAERFKQAVPDFLQPIVNDLRDASAILKLDIGVNEDAIFAAYKHDVHLLQGRLDQLQGWVKTCVRASVKPTVSAYDQGDEHVKRGWEFVQLHIPSIAHAPLIDLPVERAALPAHQLLAELKQEVNTGIGSMMRRFCLWLDLLVSKEYVGIVHFAGPTVGHYYYFRPYTTERVDVTNDSEVTVDLTVPFGEQTTYEQIERRRYKITESVERHDHHIVRAKTEPLSDYTGLIPDRIIQALNSAPDWLLPHLRVVSGDITKEVVIRRVVREQEEVHERVTSTYKGSPAIALGSYVFNGWSSDDTSSEQCSFFRGQKVFSTAKRAEVRLTYKLTAFMVAVLALIVGGIWYWVHAVNVATQVEYDAYYTRIASGKEIITLTKDQMITLPRGEPLYYLGKNQGVVLSTDQTTKWRYSKDAVGSPQIGNWYRVVPKESGPNSYYGTVDLMEAGVGIPARMHILYADNESLRFVIDYYTK